MLPVKSVMDELAAEKGGWRWGGGLVEEEKEGPFRVSMVNDHCKAEVG